MVAWAPGATTAVLAGAAGAAGAVVAAGAAGAAGVAAGAQPNNATEATTPIINIPNNLVNFIFSLLIFSFDNETLFGSLNIICKQPEGAILMISTFSSLSCLI
jgi:hypothetical protein